MTGGVGGHLRFTGFDEDDELGHTLSMKIAVTIPDDVFEEAEKLARRTGRSRSALYTRALAEYFARHSPDEVTKAMNRVCDQVGTKVDEFTTAVAQRVLERSEW